MNLVGKTFGRLTVLALVPYVPGNKNRRYIVQCSCPDKTIKEVVGNSMVIGHSTSCGCRRREVSREQALNLHKFGECRPGVNGHDGRFISSPTRDSRRQNAPADSPERSYPHP